MSSSDNHPVRPPPAAWAGVSVGASARRAGIAGATKPVMSERARAGSPRGLPFVRAGSSRAVLRREASSSGSIRSAPGSTTSSSRLWRATMRLSSAKASI